MKKDFIFICILSVIFLSSCVSAKGLMQNEDGSVSITKIDKDGSAVKYNQEYDGFENVTIIDGTKVNKLNPINVNLAAYKGKDVLFDFSCDIKIEESSGKETDVSWMINEVSANMPEVAREKIPSGKWVSMAGSVFLHLSGEQNFYLSSSGMHVENRTFYLKNFKLKLDGEGIGTKEKIEMTWKDAPSLKEAYKGKIDYFGLATNFRNEFDQRSIAEGIACQADCVTAGNEFKPDFIFNWSRPRKFGDFVAEDGKTYQMPIDVPKFDGQTKFLQMCKDVGVKMRGHVLVWHSQTPDWFFKENFDTKKPFVSREEMTAREEWYIKTVLEFVDKWEKENNNGEHIIIAWDVVNEAIADGASASKWLRTDSKWYDIFGDATFIVNAFRYANKYAPKDVKLVYNDYGCYSPNKMNAICNIIDLIKSTPDARIDCVGMQSHVRIKSPNVSGPNSFETAVQKFAAKGVDIQVTELDIANAQDPYSPYLLKAKYKEYFEMFLRNRKTEDKHGICGVTIWGIKDKGTWLNAQKEYKGHTQYPLLFEDSKSEDYSEYMCKPAFFGVLEAAQEFKE